LCAVFLFDKIAAEVAPIMFPHAFKDSNTAAKKVH
jgi:hypothetical protein